MGKLLRLANIPQINRFTYIWINLLKLTIGMNIAEILLAPLTLNKPSIN